MALIRSSCTSSSIRFYKSDITDRGYIPNSKTAVAIAKVLLEVPFSKLEVEDRMPFKVTRFGRTWRVEASKDKIRGRDWMIGGTYVIELDQYSGKVIKLYEDRR
jgi:hypothetical protein